MPKTQFVRIATSGPTIDGRNIDPKALNEMAETYDTQTYMARINTEHVRGLTGQQPFMTGGDVLALKTETIDLNVGGTVEKRTALLAELDVNDAFVALNKQGQKLYTSIEIVSDFAGKGKAYLGGLAVTDSPASLGTERLQFTAHSKLFNTIISKPDETAPLVIEYAAASPATSEAENFLSGLKTFLTGLAPQKPVETPPAPVVTPAPAPEAAGQDFAALQATFLQGFTKLSETIEGISKTSLAATEKVASDLAALQKKVETTPGPQYTTRQPVSGGGNQANLADF